jgi:haloalkane dehalogenase
MAAYRGPFPTPQSRQPIHVFPREILASRPFLAELQRALPTVTDRPALLLWPTKDPVFGARERKRWEGLFPNHRTVMLDGPLHSGRRP